tara:strand:+ start:743 stop:889 length:147 start_codon:yes stop_codon:yes gene_type:complete
MRNLEITEPYMMNTRCLCCKKLGHFTKDCQLDPNIKTEVRAGEDMKRI